MELIDVRRRIMTWQPRQVTVSGNFVHFITDMAAPLIITGTGNITVCGKNIFNYNPDTVTLLKNNSGSQRWGHHIGPYATRFAVSATLKGTETGGNFNLNIATHRYGVENASSLTSFIGSSSVTNRLLTGPDNAYYLEFISSYSSSSASGKAVVAAKFDAYNIQVEAGSSYTAFEAYNGTTLPAGAERVSLIGVNNIWSDDGSSLTVTYWTH